MSRNRFVKLASILILILVLTSSLSFASEGEGEGGGQNQDEVLEMVNCNLVDNQTGVLVDTTIRLEFNKNVVNMTVAENNKKCISLLNENGDPVSIQVLMGDDQVDPTIKRQITIDPEEKLAAGTGYVLVISENFQSKSGTTLGTPLSLGFQTKNAAAAGAQVGEVLQVGEERESATADLTALETPAEEPAWEQDGSKKLLLLFSIVSVLAGLIILAVVIRRRQR